WKLVAGGGHESEGSVIGEGGHLRLEAGAKQEADDQRQRDQKHNEPGTTSDSRGGRRAGLLRSGRGTHERRGRCPESLRLTSGVVPAATARFAERAPFERAPFYCKPGAHTG